VTAERTCVRRTRTAYWDWQTISNVQTTFGYKFTNGWSAVIRFSGGVYEGQTLIFSSVMILVIERECVTDQIQ